MRVAVVGCGYVGLVSAVGLAAVGHEVVGIETDRRRREAIAAGRAPFAEPGLPELLTATSRSGNLRVSASPAAAADADVVLLAVQTPPTAEGANDHRYLRAAAVTLADVFASHPPRRRVVAVRSTVVPGTVDDVVAPVFGGSADVAVAANPEFLREGSAVDDFLRPDRIVIGCREAWARRRLARLYRPLPAPVVQLTPPAAELSKYASNALLATTVSFANELGRLAETLTDVDVEDVLGSLHLDRRLQGDEGPVALTSYLRAGCGYGGSCLPKDVAALTAHAHDRGRATPLLDAVRQVNADQPERLVALAEAVDGDLRGRRVAVLGVAFKAGTDDLRESPGLRVVDRLIDRGATVIVHDPLVPAEALAPLADRGATVVPTLADVAGAGIWFVTTTAVEYDALPDLHARTGGAALVVDGRRRLDPARFPPGRYVAIGRGPRRTDDPVVALPDAVVESAGGRA